MSATENPGIHSLEPDSYRRLIQKFHTARSKENEVDQIIPDLRYECSLEFHERNCLGFIAEKLLAKHRNRTEENRKFSQVEQAIT